MNLGKSLKIALAKKEMKGKDLADKVGVGPVTVSHWMNNRNIKYSNLVKVCDVLEMSVSELVALGE